MIYIVVISMLVAWAVLRILGGEREYRLRVLKQDLDRQQKLSGENGAKRAA